MESLNLPAFDARFTEREGEKCIYDPVRQVFVAFTAEEWVRQHFINFLVSVKDVPLGLIAVEKGFIFQGMMRRADIVVHDRNARPWLIIECKAPSVQVSQKVFDQIGRYNSILKAPFVGVTNGIKHYCFTTEEDGIHFLTDFPNYPNHIDKEA